MRGGSMRLNSIYQRFEAVDSVKGRKIPAKQQKKLIAKLQGDFINNDEANVLIASFYNLIIKEARKIYYQFPDRDLEDLIEDGVYNLWLRLPGYDPDRGGPSTYATIVVRSAFLKELSKLRNRTAKQYVYDENNEIKKIPIPNMSLSSFLDASGNEYEPEILGRKDLVRENADERIYFEEIVNEMYRSICHSIKDYMILNTIFNMKKLPNFGGGRRRKCLRKVAEENKVKAVYVENLAQKVRPWLRKHDFLTFLSSNEYFSPVLQSVFKDSEIGDRFANEDDMEDVWDIIGN